MFLFVFGDFLAIGLICGQKNDPRRRPAVELVMNLGNDYGVGSGTRTMFTQQSTEPVADLSRSVLER